jgi:hypothetical protein
MSSENVKICRYLKLVMHLGSERSINGKLEYELLNQRDTIKTTHEINCSLTAVLHLKDVTFYHKVLITNSSQLKILLRSRRQSLERATDSLRKPPASTKLFSSGIVEY